MKPIIKYRGGKSKEIRHIIPYVPEYNGRYIEPFFGGGSMFFYLEPQCGIINDINTKLINFYLGVRDDYPHLHEELVSLEYIYSQNRLDYEKRKADNPDVKVPDENESLYYSIRDMYNGLRPSDYSEAALYYFINKTAYSGMIRFNNKGEYNVPYGRYKNFNTAIITEEHSKLLQRTKILNKDYTEIFNMAQPDDFMFLDPPYDCIFSDYGNEKYKDGFNEESHRALAEDIRNLPCRTLMVIGKTPLTEELYGNMIIGEYNKSYSVNIKNRFHSEAKHMLIANY